jgi:FkbM family methyltransferase
MIKNLAKNIVKKALYVMHIDITKNQQYDRQTNKVLKRVLTKHSNCIDIGCYKGEILDVMIRRAPLGKHWGFEPIPVMAEALRKKYVNKQNVTIQQVALSDEQGQASFNYVKNAPAYSGLMKRKYDIKKPDIQTFEVERDTLDQVIPSDVLIRLIKIDVEGAELQVLKGGEETIKRSKPYIVFECGLGASEFYGTKPHEIYNFITEKCGLKLSLMISWLNAREPLTKDEFCHRFEKKIDHYFVAHP